MDQDKKYLEKPQDILKST
uniref:Uncharacterized protein n=1 Tax=Rhizophora mucronata TaxID=61149 RepID=A0A2P2P055_RHIMU